jgi:hypothetical protein
VIGVYARYVRSLAEELLASSQKTEQAAEVLRDMENVRRELEELKVRWGSSAFSL